jgi:hypothetical protein
MTEENGANQIVNIKVVCGNGTLEGKSVCVRPRLIDVTCSLKEPSEVLFPLEWYVSIKLEFLKKLWVV